MFLKKVLNQPNLVGTVMIALMVCGGFVYAFAFDGFNVETATGGEVEAWLAQAGGGNSGDGDDDDDDDDVVCDCLWLPGQPIDRSCGDCKTDYECGGELAECDTNCIKKTDEKNKSDCSCTYGTKCKNLCGGESCVSE